MNILYITQTYPFSIYSGGHIKTILTIKYLLHQKNSISLCCFVTKNKELKKSKDSALKNFKTVIMKENSHITGDESKIIKLSIFLKSLFSNLPFTAYKFSDRLFKKKICTLVQNTQFDCIWIDHVNMAQYLPNNYTGLKIIETHNIDSLFFFRMAFNDSSFILRLFAFIEFIKYRLWENNLYHKFHKIFTISHNDKKHLDGLLNKKNVEIFPLSVAKPKKLSTGVKKIPYTMLFVGSLRWYPNKDGVNWFLNDIYPSIKNEFPQLQFWVIGDCSDIYKRKKITGVTFFGYLKNIDKYYNKAQLFIVPIRYGSGIRIKILEALTKRIGIITTQEGADGLPKKFINSKNIKIVEKDNFRTSIIKYFNLSE